MRYRFAIGIFVAALAAAGCGGGGTSTSSQGPTGTQTVQLGQAQVSFTSQPTSQIGVSGQTVSVYGMAGTTFPDVILDPPPTLSNTAILFSNGAQRSLWTYANGQVNPIGGIGLNLANNGDWTHDGHIIYIAYDNSSSHYQIYESNYDGSASHKLTNSVNITSLTRAVWSPLNNLIAFDDGSDNIYTISTTGTGETLRLTGGLQPCFSPDGKTIAFADNANATISTIPIGGGAITPIGPTGNNNNYTYPNYSADGNFVAFTTSPTSEASHVEIDTVAGQDVGFYTPPTISSYSGSFSPDGTQVAYLLQSGSTTGDQSLVTSTYVGSKITTVVPIDDGLDPIAPSWSPFPGPQRFVAATIGTVMPSASGFLFAQAGDHFGGFAAFTAKTPADATITSEGAPTGTAPYTFDIHADEVTSLKYTNGFYSAVTTVSTGNYSDVLVSVSSVSGQISFVTPILPKRANGALAKPVVTHSNGNTVYTGSFAGLWNAKGKNLAPSGLSQYRLDSKGNLIDFH